MNTNQKEFIRLANTVQTGESNNAYLLLGRLRTQQLLRQRGLFPPQSQSVAGGLEDS